ncbi:hypothetical protein JCM11491_000835 [Sporobolomyces phaffii]
MATVAFDVCCCLFSAKGIVVICSGLLAATYLGVAYVLRKVAFPMLKKLHENWLSYMVIKYAHIPVMDWISEIKVVQLFLEFISYLSGRYGLAGLLGALFEVQLLLYPYVVYLCGSAYLSGKKVYDLVQDFLKFQNKLLESCNKVGGVLGLNCDEEFATAKKASPPIYGFAAKTDVYRMTLTGGIVIALLMCTTLFCSIKLIYNIHRDTGAWLFTFCGASRGFKLALIACTSLVPLVGPVLVPIQLDRIDRSDPEDEEDDDALAHPQDGSSFVWISVESLLIVSALGISGSLKLGGFSASACWGIFGVLYGIALSSE